MNKRRKLLLALSGASAATVWTKPVVNAVVLPAHAQTSLCGIHFNLNATSGAPLEVYYGICPTDATDPSECFVFREVGGTGSGANTIDVTEYMPAGTYGVFLDASSRGRATASISCCDETPITDNNNGEGPAGICVTIVISDDSTCTLINTCPY